MKSKNVRSFLVNVSNYTDYMYFISGTHIGICMYKIPLAMTSSF